MIRIQSGAAPSIFAFVLLALAGCGSSVDTTSMELKAERLYGSVATGGMSDMLNMYSDEFYEFVDREEWREALTEIYAVLGDYESHEFLDSIITASVKEGSTVTLIYDVTYAEHRVIEQLTFRDGDTPLLIRHQFNTDADLPTRNARTGEGDSRQQP